MSRNSKIALARKRFHEANAKTNRREATIESLRQQLAESKRENEELRQKWLSPETYQTLMDERQELLHELAEAQRDAERYRWLRENAYQAADHLGPVFVVEVRRKEDTLFDFDAAIDQAMREGE